MQRARRQALLDPEQRGPFWDENCAGSPFALASWALNAHGEADEELKLPAQAHSASAAYPWGEVKGGMAMKDYVFKKSYIDAPLMPFHTLRARFFDEQKEYGKQIMVRPRAPHGRHAVARGGAARRGERQGLRRQGPQRRVEPGGAGRDAALRRPRARRSC